MTEQERIDAFKREVKTLTAKVGKGRNRRFANKVDLSLEGVNAWRKQMGLEPLVKLPDYNSK